jgi:hypothetical protein
MVPKAFSIPLLMRGIFLFHSSFLGNKEELMILHSGCFSLISFVISSISVARFWSGGRCSMSLVPQ